MCRLRNSIQYVLKIINDSITDSYLSSNLHSQCPLRLSLSYLTALQWALIELCKKPDKQQKLRDELSQFSGTNPTFDQLSSGLLPYLDAVTQEVLRLHPPIHETTRVVRPATYIYSTRPSPH